MIKVPGAYVLLGGLSTANSTPSSKRPPCMASAFLGKYASITVVNLMHVNFVLYEATDVHCMLKSVSCETIYIFSLCKRPGNLSLSFYL